MTVVGVTPYSIGTGLLGDVITFLVYRGEPFPAFGETTLSTVKDNQESCQLTVYQGEHFLEKLNDLVGSTELTELPPMPRGQCSMLVQVEYDCNGILQFSAREISTGRSIKATFVAKTEFTEEDQTRLAMGSSLSREAEVHLANLQSLREEIKLDIVRAESHTAKQELLDAAGKWREWLEAHEEGAVRMFIEKHYDLQCEFHTIYPEKWQMPEHLELDPQFSVIWPSQPTFIHQGAAIIRFSTASDI
jgi:molecular chaperone DnaK (HSP70)